MNFSPGILVTFISIVGHIDHIPEICPIIDFLQESVHNGSVREPCMRYINLEDSVKQEY